MVKMRASSPWGPPIGAALGLAFLTLVFVALASANVIPSRAAWWAIAAGIAYFVTSLATVVVLRRRQRREG